MPKRTCRNCRFSTHVKVRNEYGEIVDGDYLECHRYPPKYMTVQVRSPTVGFDDSCGEWKDDSTSPETEARQGLRQQLVVAMVAAGSTLDPGALWEEASRITACDPEVNND